MLFGKLSAIFIAVAGAVFLTIWILQPEWGSPFLVLGLLVLLFCVPVSLMFGIIGVLFDSKKWLAMITTAIAGVPLIIFLYSLAMRMGLFTVFFVF